MDRCFTPCGHFFCRGCIRKWLISGCAGNFKCPLCRMVLTEKFYHLVMSPRERPSDNTRFTIAIRKVKKYNRKWNLGLINDEDDVYKISKEISDIKILFGCDRFKKRFNRRMSYYAIIYGDRFLGLIKN